MKELQRGFSPAMWAIWGEFRRPATDGFYPPGPLNVPTAVLLNTWHKQWGSATRLQQLSIKSESQKSGRCSKVFCFIQLFSCLSPACGWVPRGDWSFPFPKGELTPLCYCSGSRPETRDRAVDGPQLIVWPRGYKILLYSCYALFMTTDILGSCKELFR